MDQFVLHVQQKRKNLTVGFELTFATFMPWPFALPSCQLQQLSRILNKNNLGLNLEQSSIAKLGGSLFGELCCFFSLLPLAPLVRGDL